MKIINFEDTGLSDICLWIKNNRKKNITKEMLIEVLKVVNITFIVEDLNRAQSMLLCELKDSYIQQSQRYVTMDKSAYGIPLLCEMDRVKAEELINKAFVLYGKMSELKEGDFKGRPKIENYKHGIPIEDARYILPLATKTNMSITMSGDKLFDLFLLINNKKYFDLFCDFRKKIVAYLPAPLTQQLSIHCNNANTDTNADIIVEQFYNKYMDVIDIDNRMVYIDGFKELNSKVGLGALVSTSSKIPEKFIIKQDYNFDKEFEGVIERVLGYGHNSILEKARTTFGMMCSMVTYHQQIRHRLSINHREDFLKIIRDKKREVIVPPSIKNSKFYEEFLELTNEFKKFRFKIFKKYNEGKALPFLLNCDQIKLIISTNARIDNEMLADRICFNAQWEIRDLSIEKLKALRGLSSILYESALPSCINGKCKEGKLSCGKDISQLL